LSQNGHFLEQLLIRQFIVKFLVGATRLHELTILPEEPQLTHLLVWQIEWWLSNSQNREHKTQDK